MNNNHKGAAPFFYLLAITITSVFLIIVNSLFNLMIPFTVHFLIAYVCGLMVFVIWHSLLTKGWKRTLLMLFLSFVLAFTAEALGVNFGLIFGSYHYSSVLGIQILGVPLLAALAWEPIIYAAFTITDILAPYFMDSTSPLLRRLPSYLLLGLIGSLATTAWDMMIDPIAVSQGWWVWHGGGEYLPYLSNGVPIQNFLGWLSVSFLINFLYRLISDGRIPQYASIELSIFGPITLYISLFLTSFGVSITILRRPEVALVGLLAMGPFIIISLTNLNLFQRGLATLLGSSLPEMEIKNGRIKAGNNP
jgi:uncharacterized membrane protein